MQQFRRGTGRIESTDENRNKLNQKPTQKPKGSLWVFASWFASRSSPTPQRYQMRLSSFVGTGETFHLTGNGESLIANFRELEFFQTFLPSRGPPDNFLPERWLKVQWQGLQSRENESSMGALTILFARSKSRISYPRGFGSLRCGGVGYDYYYIASEY